MHPHHTSFGKKNWEIKSVCFMVKAKCSLAAYEYALPHVISQNIISEHFLHEIEWSVFKRYFFDWRPSSDKIPVRLVSVSVDVSLTISMYLDHSLNQQSPNIVQRYRVLNDFSIEGYFSLDAFEAYVYIYVWKQK